eukprot:TRINITY_DN45463_c0_g1_i1.p1 TRINITY_DN45463_c0_g1~~TRINITY_DN45463_c0_g1_i1.p1  ORF type:complete len:213 (+),score=21.62 TRINITY_DN45463_c0_g1_i1:48-686(+)
MFKFKDKTFKPKKSYKKSDAVYDLHKNAKATLGSGDLSLAVKLPEGEDINEWLAVNTVDFFNQVNLLYASVVEYCTEMSCPLMSAGPNYEYLWADSKTKKPSKLSAPDYIDHLMNWIQALLDDETIFPSRVDVSFPKSFNSHVKNIFRRLFRVYGHLYYSHFSEVVRQGEEAHLNTCFKHFVFFVREFQLIEKKEMAPLEDLIENLIDSKRK